MRYLQENSLLLFLLIGAIFLWVIGIYGLKTKRALVRYLEGVEITGRRAKLINLFYIICAIVLTILTISYPFWINK